MKTASALHHTLSTQQKVESLLVTQVYKQSGVGQVTSFFCATIVLIGLYPIPPNTPLLIGWYIFSVIVALTRFTLPKIYLKYHVPYIRVSFWRRIFILGALLGGISWGIMGGLLFPLASDDQQTLIVLILAGITAGATPLLSGQLTAAIAFIILTILPLTLQLFLSSFNNLYWLFGFAAIAYTIYLIIVCKRANDLLRYTIGLQFENDELLKNLSQAKSQLEIINKKLQQAATHDPLTELANRNLFNTSLENSLVKARLTGKKLALLYLDLDNFKFVNDEYGHHVGDHLLIKLVKRLRHSLRESDIVSRLGGDEFTIILENILNPDSVSKIANQICQVMNKPVVVNGLELRVSASIGISIYPTDGTTAETLLRNADKAMYYAKEHGRNFFHFNTAIK